jgi:hypothetical protein
LKIQSDTRQGVQSLGVRRRASAVFFEDQRRFRVALVEGSRVRPVESDRPGAAVHQKFRSPSRSKFLASLARRRVRRHGCHPFLPPSRPADRKPSRSGSRLWSVGLDRTNPGRGSSKVTTLDTVRPERKKMVAIAIETIATRQRATVRQTDRRRKRRDETRRRRIGTKVRQEHPFSYTLVNLRALARDRASISGSCCHRRAVPGRETGISLS